MSSESDLEEFYDAEDGAERSLHKRRASEKIISTVDSRIISSGEEKGGDKTRVEFEDEKQTATTMTNEGGEDFEKSNKDDVLTDKLHGTKAKEKESKVKEIEKRRKKLEEARRRMQTEENDDAYELLSSVPGSQSSSIDGVWATVRTTNVLTARDDGRDESGSATISLGKVGSILGEKETDLAVLETEPIHTSCDGSTSTNVPLVTLTMAETPTGDEHVPLIPGMRLQEPDLVTSAKGAIEKPPVAPPRRKRSKQQPPIKPMRLETTLGKDSLQGIPSPASTIESLTKEFEHSLDLPSAIRGQYVVKPQDEERTKADGPSGNYVLCIGEGNIIGEFDDDPATTKQLNMVLRTRTDSGKELTDIEILEQVTVLNLDTGERIPLSLAEDRLPQGVNPLSLHIMRLTSEYVSNSSLETKESDDDADSTKSKIGTLSGTLDNIQVKKKTAQFKKLINRTVEKTVSKIKSVADEVYHTRHGEDTMESSEEEATGDVRQTMKVKSSSSHKGPCDFSNLKLVQDLSGEHSGAVWTMKFSYCGRLLATVGQDHILRIWVLKDSYDYFNDMRQKYNTEASISPTPSQESLTSHNSGEDTEKTNSAGVSDEPDPNSDCSRIFAPKPFCTYVGHTADLLDVSWSKNYFILTSSMDKTVRLWHISRKECLCCFQHIDFVTAIAFHPRDDRYFLSGSLDGKLRLWNIPDKKVALWNELDGQTKLITSANFCQNGKFAVVGTYDGRCVFYTTEQLKYYTQIHVRSTRGKNAKGRKISGIEPMPGEDKILVTSNDSRVRLYDLRDLSLSCKYKGYANVSSQIRASFSHDGKYIATGSENQYIYIWKTHHDYAKFSSARKDRNDYWESIKIHNAVVTAAVFAPSPSIIFRQMEQQKNTTGSFTDVSQSASGAPLDGYVLVTADFSGGVKVFVNKIKSGNQKGVQN